MDIRLATRSYEAWMGRQIQHHQKVLKSILDVSVQFFGTWLQIGTLKYKYLYDK